jgi:hypothetical protein
MYIQIRWEKLDRLATVLDSERLRWALEAGLRGMDAHAVGRSIMLGRPVRIVTDVGTYILEAEELKIIS